MPHDEYFFTAENPEYKINNLVIIQSGYSDCLF